MDTQYVLYAGNPIDGATIYGPFDSCEDATTYAEQNVAGDSDWHVVPLVRAIGMPT